LSVVLLDLLLKLLSNNLLFFVVHLSEFFMPFDFGFNALILFFNHIDFRVKLIHIVVEGVVLFLSLDEGGDNLFEVTDTSLLFDLLEGILDDVNITDVHVHKVLLLFVVIGPFL
jgi:hypothetical protein